MMTEAQTTTPATRALSELIDTARARALTAREAGREVRALAHENIAKTLDATRTRLVQDGVEYLDQAWAFVDGARTSLAYLAGDLA